VVPPLLSIRDLSKGYVGVQALDGVGLDVLPGEVHALVGENGAGKSTLLKILSGAVHPDEGSILLDGQRLDRLTPHSARDAGISLIHQELALVPQLDAIANIFIGRQLRSGPRLDRTEMRRRTQEVLERLGFDVDLRLPVSRLSIAQRQGVEIARALLDNTRVLALDEPTSSITNQERDRLFAAIRRLRDEGVGIIYVSHRMEELFEIADRATVLRDGQLVGCVDMATTTAQELVRMMVGRDLGDQATQPTRPRGAEALRVESVSAGPLVRDVSFTAYHGQVLGIAGLVGAGRTELLRAIFGAEPIRSGRVVVNGHELSGGSPAEAIGQGLGLLPEDRKDEALVLGMPVSANITIARSRKFSRAGFLRKGRRRREVTRLVSELGIRPPQPERPVGQLSGGNQQKVIIARWLCAGSRVLLFDEPTRGIDVGAKADIYRLMDQHVRAGGAIVMVSSDLPEVLQVSDRVLVMRQGQIVHELDRDTASEELIMQHATGGTR
jgi:ribose transport system ATP-binding protein